MIEQVRPLAIFLFFIQAAAAQPASRHLGKVAGGNGPSVHVVAFGDWGYRGHGSGQEAVAATIARLHAATPFQLGLLLGDNFYPSGVSSVNDVAWRDLWENGYHRLGIPFFATLGNHDYRGNAQAQIDYSSRSTTWRMPFRYYTFESGPAQFFALDTDEGTAGRLLFRPPWSDEQARWLDGELARSTARWKIVYGHHPIWSDGHHGDDRRLVAKLLPILEKHHVDLYVCGHEHELQAHARNGMYFLIAGGGGKDIRPVTKRRAEFAASKNGFLEIYATAEKLEWKLRGSDGAELFAKTLSQTRNAPASQPR